MKLRAIPAEMAAVAVSEVDSLIDAVRREHGVHIAWAIESGSRAWGFPSPDSDYDGRFIYVRPAVQALTVWPHRDVIEMPIVGEMDVNGWDLGKALRLLLKGNAVVVEWLQSPIIYEGYDWFRDELLAFATQWMDRDRAASHYLHLSRRQRSVYLADEAEVALKKVFYALRPAVALRWLRRHPEHALPPMHFPTLMAECAPPLDVAGIVEDLIALKATTREMGSGPMPKALLTFIDEELALAKDKEIATRSVTPEAVEAANALFRSITLRLDGGE